MLVSMYICASIYICVCVCVCVCVYMYIYIDSEEQTLHIPESADLRT